MRRSFARTALILMLVLMMGCRTNASRQDFNQSEREHEEEGSIFFPLFFVPMMLPPVSGTYPPR